MVKTTPTKIAMKLYEDSIATDKITAYYSSYTNNLGDVYQPYLDPLRVYDMLKNQLAKKYTPLMKFEHKAHVKWSGPQGGKPSIEDATHLAESYYGYVPNRTTNPVSGIAHMKAILDATGIKIPQDVVTLDEAWIKAMKPTNSGVTDFGKRNEWNVVHNAIKHVLQNPGVFKPLMLMTRFSKNKLRAIFNDDISNYLVEAPYVLPLYEIFQNHVEAALMLQGRYAFTRYISAKQLLTQNTIVLEGDAKALDQTWTLDATKAFVEPIMFHLYDEKHHKAIEEFHEKLFTTELVLPDGTIRQGEHSLFSGILPTNIYETIGFSVVHYDRLINSTFPSGVSLITEATLFVIGDDVVIFLNGKNSTAVAQQLREDPNLKWIRYNGSMYEGKEWQSQLLIDAGFEAQPMKQGVHVGHANFCKREFSPHMPSYTNVHGVEISHSVRSLMATINSINNPEFGRNTGPDELIRILGILDDAYGHPLWNNLCDMLFKEVRRQYKFEALNIEHVERYNRSRQKKFDWVLEGYEWSMESSPAWHRWIGIPFDISTAPQY